MPGGVGALAGGILTATSSPFDPAKLRLRLGFTPVAQIEGKEVSFLEAKDTCKEVRKEEKQRKSKGIKRKDKITKMVKVLK